MSEQTGGYEVLREHLAQFGWTLTDLLESEARTWGTTTYFRTQGKEPIKIRIEWVPAVTTAGAVET